MAGTVVVDAVKSSTTGAPAFQNTNGTEIGTLCRAWVSITSNTGAIKGSFNISSVTRTTTGTYAVSFTNALPDANYALAAWCDGGNKTINGNSVATTGVNILVYNGGTGNTSDQNTTVAFFR